MSLRLLGKVLKDAFSDEKRVPVHTGGHFRRVGDSYTHVRSHYRRQLRPN